MPRDLVETFSTFLESEVQIGEVKAYGYVLYNKKREGLETNSFYNRLIDIECALEGKEFRNPIDQFKRDRRQATKLFKIVDFIHRS